MKTAAVICEYDPVHTGHKRLLDRARAHGADVTVAVMSGNFVQRGEPAVTDKYVRASAALRMGADLVLELPMPYSALSAEFFASAGVSIAERIGADELWFGSESGDVAPLSAVAENMLELEDEASTRDKSLGHAVATSELYRERFGSEPTRTPNDILGVEYIKAIKRQGLEIEPVTLDRENNFSGETLTGTYPSSTALRKAIKSGGADALDGYMSEDALSEYKKAEADGRFPANIGRYYELLLAFYRIAEAERISLCHGCGGGLAEFIISCARGAKNAPEFVEALKTKKYTDARIRRTLLSGVLGVTDADARSFPSYVTLLAANERGRALVARARKKDGAVTVVTKTADLRGLGALAERQIELSARANALYTLLMPEPREAAYFRKIAPTII